MIVLAASATGVAAIAVLADGSAERPPAPGRCPATPVDGDYVRAGPFTGAITRPYDVLDGRFRLRVGGYRDRSTGLTQKIAWSVSRRADVGSRLLVVARRLPPLPARRFTTTLGRTYATGDARRWFFPSILEPPAEGCWRLRFSSGRVVGDLVVLVRG